VRLPTNSDIQQALKPREQLGLNQQVTGDENCAVNIWLLPSLSREAKCHCVVRFKAEMIVKLDRHTGSKTSHIFKPSFSCKFA